MPTEVLKVVKKFVYRVFPALWFIAFVSLSQNGYAKTKPFQNLIIKRIGNEFHIQTDKITPVQLSVRLQCNLKRKRWQIPIPQNAYFIIWPESGEFSSVLLERFAENEWCYTDEYWGEVCNYDHYSIGYYNVYSKNPPKAVIKKSLTALDAFPFFINRVSQENGEIIIKAQNYSINNLALECHF